MLFDLPCSILALLLIAIRILLPHVARPNWIYLYGMSVLERVMLIPCFMACLLYFFYKIINPLLHTGHFSVRMTKISILK